MDEEGGYRQQLEQDVFNNVNFSRVGLGSLLGPFDGQAVAKESIEDPGSDYMLFLDMCSSNAV